MMFLLVGGVSMEAIMNTRPAEEKRVISLAMIEIFDKPSGTGQT
jgi:hypothetical protein